MSKYTIEDVKHLIPQELTMFQRAGVERYLNSGVIPAADSCMDCDPAYIRKLIAVIQTAERNGLWPPKRPEFTVAPVASSPSEEEHLALDEGGYTEGKIGPEELENIKAKRPEMFEPVKGKPKGKK